MKKMQLIWVLCGITLFTYGNSGFCSDNFQPILQPATVDTKIPKTSLANNTKDPKSQKTNSTQRTPCFVRIITYPGRVVLRTPKAIIRRSVKEMHNGIDDMASSYNTKLILVPATIVSIPFGIASGTAYGIYEGISGKTEHSEIKSELNEDKQPSNSKLDVNAPEQE